MTTQQEMESKASKIADYYSYLQQHAFYLIVDTFNKTKSILNQSDKDSILEWRLKALAQRGALTDNVVNFMSRHLGVATKQIYDLCKKDGLQVAQDMNKQVADMLGQPVQDVSDSTLHIIDSYANQAYLNINNYVNQTLLSTNFRSNAVLNTYQDIINKTVLDVTTGLKTSQEALKDNIYQWQDKGIGTVLVDKGGHHWTMEGYTRTVINSTAHRVFNEARMSSMKQYNVSLAVMTSHPASRPACAPIQGKVVNLVPREDANFDPEYDTIYDHGYGEAWGTQGINCHHMFYPYKKGVSHNYQKQYDPEEAIENENIRQKQRYYERNIRKLKARLSTAKKLDDNQEIVKTKKAIYEYQGKIRSIVNKYPFLNRNYDNEQLFTKEELNISNKLKDANESYRHIATMISTGKWGTKINYEKQAPHIESTKINGKSYLFDSEDPQKLLDSYSGKGVLEKTKNGKFTNKEIVKIDHKVGIDYNANKETSWVKIHHSKDRTHIVPYLPKKREN